MLKCLREIWVDYDPEYGDVGYNFPFLADLIYSGAIFPLVLGIIILIILL